MKLILHFLTKKMLFSEVPNGWCYSVSKMNGGFSVSDTIKNLTNMLVLIVVQLV